MALSYRYYRNSLIKLALVSAASIGIFWDDFFGRSRYSVAFLACLALTITAANAALFFAMRRAKRSEDVTARQMNELESAAGRTERDIVASLFRVGAELNAALASVPSPFVIVSDAKGFTLNGIVRVVEVQGSKTLSRVVAKGDKVLTIETGRQ